MSNSAIHPYPILDDRLDGQSSVGFGVYQGAQSINQMTYTAQTTSASTVSISCLIPSLQTVIDRAILVKTQTTLLVTGTPLANQYLINFGTNSASTGGAGALNCGNTCLNSFPFSRGVSQTTCQINNATLSMNYESELDIILKQMNQAELAKYADLCPVGYDIYNNCATAQLQVNQISALRSQYANTLQSSADMAIPARGAFVIDQVGFAINGTNYANTIGDGNTQVTVSVQFTTTEPYFLSPFCYGDSLDSSLAGLYGVSALNFTFNMLADAGRMIRCGQRNANNNTPYTATIQAINSCQIIMNLLTPKPSQLLPLTCALPYVDLPVYKTQIPAGVTRVVSSVIAPNTVPDKIYIAIRKPNRSTYDADSYFPINNLSITWGTQSGILAPCNKEQLYTFSKRGGCSLSYEAWSGFSGGYAGQNSVGQANAVNMVGGYVVLNMGEVIPLADSWVSSGSIGTFSIMVTASFDNNTDGTVPATELLIILQNSGVILSVSGSSSSYVGLLNRETVLNMAEQEPVNHTQNKRMLGGGWLDSLKSVSTSALKNLVPLLAPIAKEQLANSDNKFAKLASMGIGMAGYGRKPRHH